MNIKMGIVLSLILVTFSCTTYVRVSRVESGKRVVESTNEDTLAFSFFESDKQLQHGYSLYRDDVKENEAIGIRFFVEAIKGKKRKKGIIPVEVRLTFIKKGANQEVNLGMATFDMQTYQSYFVGVPFEKLSEVSTGIVTFSFFVEGALVGRSSIEMLSASRRKVSQKRSEIEAKNYDQEATFPGDNLALTQFIVDQMKYPQKAKDNGDEGEVMIYMELDSNGAIIHAECLNSDEIAPELCAEAERVVNLMPNWNPALKNNKPVASKMVLPFRFSIGS